MRRRCAALLCGLAADQVLPELPNRLHPVVWMGRWLKLGERLAPRGATARLGWGAAWCAAGMALGAAGALWATRAVPPVGRPAARLAAPLQGLAAQTLFAYRALDAAVGEVEAALAAGDLPEARRLLGWHLVSRPTAGLDEAEVAAAAIESLAENLADSLVAPLAAYLAGGLPALAAYRFANTADAMWGYRTPRFEQLGKAAARCDDALNAAPSRLTALLLVVTAANPRAAWRVAARDHGRTASPNAGWPMAAMAGALGTTLTKIGHYSLGDGARRPDAALIAESRRHARRAVLLLTGALAIGALAGPESTEFA